MPKHRKRKKGVKHFGKIQWFDRTGMKIAWKGAREEKTSKDRARP